MPTGTGIGTFDALEGVGVGSIPGADNGPSTRFSTFSFDIRLSGEYWDEVPEIPILDKISWTAEGFKGISDRPGTGAGQSNRFWYKKALRIEQAQSVDLDMYSFLTVDIGVGFGQDPLGLPITMDAVTLLMILNRQGSADLLVGGASTAPWTAFLTGRMRLRNGYGLRMHTSNATAYTVTSGTSQFLRLEPDGGACTVDVYIAGRKIGG